MTVVGQSAWLTVTFQITREKISSGNNVFPSPSYADWTRTTRRINSYFETSLYNPKRSRRPSIQAQVSQRELLTPPTLRKTQHQSEIPFLTPFRINRRHLYQLRPRSRSSESATRKVQAVHAQRRAEVLRGALQSERYIRHCHDEVLVRAGCSGDGCCAGEV